MFSAHIRENLKRCDWEERRKRVSAGAEIGSKFKPLSCVLVVLFDQKIQTENIPIGEEQTLIVTFFMSHQTTESQ